MTRDTAKNIIEMSKLSNFEVDLPLLRDLENYLLKFESDVKIFVVETGSSTANGDVICEIKVGYDLCSCFHFDYI